MYKNLGISSEVLNFGNEIENNLKERFKIIDEVAEYNQLKVIRALQENRVSVECFNKATGYGYDDVGRDTLEKVYASVFKTEDALVRPQITCGTHALALTLSAILRPGDELLSPVGKPYDTLEGVIGIKKDEKGEVRNLNAHFSCSKCSDVSIQINGESKFFGFEVDITGTEGRILIGNGIFKLFVKEESKLYSNFYSLEEDKSVKGPKHSGYFSNMYKNAVEFLDGKAELKSTLQTGMNTLAIIDRIKERLH